MKLFLIKSLLFLVICSGLIYLTFFVADGHADGLYLKFTSPKQNSLILGTSKATEGIQPSVLNSKFNRKDIYNYAFTVVHSPYGPYYLRSIKKKLNSSAENGIFILQVDPYGVASTASNPENIQLFREKEGAVGMIENVNSKPNLEYLLYHYPYQYVFLFKRKLGNVGKGFLHDDGWVEITENMNPSEVKKREESKVEAYRKRTAQYNISQIRLTYLEKTIEFLQYHGEVYLVRMPVAKPLLDLENELDPEFNSRMQNMADNHSISYLDYSHMHSEFEYLDGNHLSKNSSTLFSEILAKDINRLNDIGLKN